MAFVEPKAMWQWTGKRPQLDGVNVISLHDNRRFVFLEPEFYALGAGCADDVCAATILDAVGHQSTVNLRCDAKRRKRMGTDARTAYENSTRERKVFLRVECRNKSRNGVVANSNKD